MAVQSCRQEQCESRGGGPGLPVPNKPCGLCGRKATLNWVWSELRSRVKVEVAVLGSPSLISLTVSVDTELNWTRTRAVNPPLRIAITPHAAYRDWGQQMWLHAFMAVQTTIIIIIRRWRLVSRAVVIPPTGVIKVVDNKVYRHQCPNKPRYTFILQTNKAGNQLENQPTNDSLKRRLQQPDYHHDEGTHSHLNFTQFVQEGTVKMKAADSFLKEDDWQLM